MTGGRPRPGVDLTEVTIVVPTRNEANNIVTFLGSLPAGAQVMVVDSSTDHTRQLIAEHRPENTRVVAAELNIPEARQVGADLASTPWLLFTDADVIFPPGYFERLSAIEIGPRVGGIVGTKATVDGFDTYHRWFLRGQAVLDTFGVPAATGSNMLLRRSALAEIGGFDRRLTVNEDTEVMFRMARSRHEVAFHPALAVLATDHRRLEAGLVRKIVHGAVRNTALWTGLFGTQVRDSDWGYWNAVEHRAGRSGGPVASPGRR